MAYSTDLTDYRDKKFQIRLISMWAIKVNKFTNLNELVKNAKHSQLPKVLTRMIRDNLELSDTVNEHLIN